MWTIEKISGDIRKYRKIFVTFLMIPCAWKHFIYLGVVPNIKKRFSMFSQKVCLNLIFTNWAELVIESPCPYVCMYVCMDVCAIECSFFRGLSLALRSHDQIPASHWSNGKKHLHYFCLLHTKGKVFPILEELEISFWGQIGVEFNFQSTGAHYRCGGRIRAAH